MSGFKKFLKVILFIILAVILVVAGYLAYVFISYNRIEDNITLNVDKSGMVADDAFESGKEYSVLTYNIGFGAYTPDYSFFMDGGEHSWAVSKEGLTENVKSIGTLVADNNPDVVILQEVDTDGTRTYHVNEYEMLKESMGSKNYIYASNFHSAFLMYPVTEPHGANNSGIVTASEFKVVSAPRRQLPISTSVKKIVDLDRCYSVTKFEVSNGKTLCVYNVHLSEYGSDDSVREGQLGMLFADMKADYEAGNYVICGGDFNHNLRQTAEGKVPGWATNFPIEKLPEGFGMGYKIFEKADIEHNTCRDADIPYSPDKSFTVMVDGFIVSDNVEITGYNNIDTSYAYSDHDPVLMKFILK